MNYGFVKMAAATPAVRLGDVAHNLAAALELASIAAEQGVGVLAFPELSLTGATCGDLYGHDQLLQAAAAALAAYAEGTAGYNLVSVVGLPVAFADRVYNCAAVVAGGAILGLVPKTRLSSAERRIFAPAPQGNLVCDILGDGSYIPLGTKQIFVATTQPGLRLCVEFGRDMASPGSPAIRAASAGATLVVCPDAQPEYVGGEDYRRMLVASQSARLLCGYLYVSAGEGESTTDGVYAGHAILCEAGHVLEERRPFEEGTTLTVWDLDLDRLAHDRRVGDFDTSSVGELTEGYFTLLPTPDEQIAADRHIPKNPFVPEDEEELASRCERILAIQAAGLRRRMEAAHARRLVLGISGGLDSTLALLVIARALDEAGRPRSDALAVTMPCFGTTERTKSNATILCEELGVDFRCVDIFDAVNGHFRDIGHDPSIRDVTYENSQARERTQILMDIANEENALVVGTGDLSELVLGWATYNGDHMSMYGVNGGVPKTLIRHIVAHVAAIERSRGKETLAGALEDILATPVSPELLPADESGDIAQRTEDLVGPYEIHDFYLYYFLRYGFTPEKLFFMARRALGERYDDKTLLYWLETFHRRFFAQQFKRSCLPDGPAVGRVSVSPRGGLSMPSDASSALWQASLRALRESLTEA